MKYFAALFFSMIAFRADALSMEETENIISKLHSGILSTSFDNDREAICEQMREHFIAAFENPEVFSHPFEEFKFCKLISPDRKIRLFNWNLPYMDGTHKYFCFVLEWDAKKKNYTWTELIDNVREPAHIEDKVLKSDKWLGALYYEIIPMEKKNCRNYTLLGWDGKDNLSTRKIIEVMNIAGNKIRFGDNVFREEDNKNRKRIILEYSDEVSVTLKYYAKEQCIVMDHLAPKNPLMAGIYSEYGPYGTYNMLTLNKGRWELTTDADVSKFSTDQSSLLRSRHR